MKTTFRLVLALGLATTASPALATVQADDAARESASPARVERQHEERSTMRESLAVGGSGVRTPARGAGERTSREAPARQDPFDRSMDAGG